MSGPTITMCPTMANPEAFDNVDKLRQELHRANSSLLQLTKQLHRERYAVERLSDSLANLVLAHMRGEHDDVKNLPDLLVTKHIKVVKMPQGGVH